MPAMTIEMRAQTENARNQVVSALNAMNREALVLARQLNGLSSAMTTQRDLVDRARTAYQNTSDRIRQLKDNVKQFKDELGNTNTALTNNQAKIERARAATERYNQKLNDAIATHGAFSKEAYRVSQQLDNAARRAGSAQAAFVALTARKKQLAQQIADTNKQVAALNTQLVKEGKSLHEATQRAAELAAQKARLAAQARDLQTSINGTNRQLSEMNRAIREDDRALRDMGGAMAVAVAAGNIMTGMIRSIRDGIINLVQETTMYAARTEELGIVLEQVARVNGISAGQIFAQERAIRRLNVSTQETRQVLSQFVAAQMDVARASELARVAQDLAVIAGADTAETFTRLTQGIQTLQIRVLRTAGVFVSLDGTLDQLARTTGRSRDSFSESEKQAALLNEVLEYGARAVGTYDAAMTSASKQIRSMTRLWNDAKNELGSFTQGPLLLIVKILSEFLKLVTAAPGAVLVFVGAMTGMLAIITKNAIAGTALGATFSNIARQIALATKELFVYSAAANTAAGSSVRLAGANSAVSGTGSFTSGRFVTGIAGGAAPGVGSSLAAGAAARAGITTLGLSGGAAAGGAALSATGVGLAALAGGAAIYAIYQYLKAADEVSFAKEEDIKLTLRQYDANRKDAAAFREQATAIRTQGEAYEEANGEQRRYQMALERANPAQRDAILNDNNRAQSLLKLADALDEVNRRNVRDLYSSMEKNVAGLATNVDRTRTAQEALETVQANRRFYGRQAGPLSRFATNVGTLVTEGTWAEEGLRAREHDAHVEYVTQIEERKRAIDAMAEVALKMKDTQNLSTESFLGNIRGLQKGSKVYQELHTHIEAYIAQKERERRGDQSLIEFKESLKTKLDEVQLANMDVSRTSEGLIKVQRLLMQQLQNSTNSGRSWSETIGMSSEAILQFDRDLGAVSSSVEDYYKRFSQLDPVLQSAIADAGRQSGKAVETVSEAMASMQQRLDQVNVRLRNLRREITEIFSGQGLAGQLEVLESRLQRVRQEQQTYIDLNVELGRNPSTPPESAEERDSAIRAMQRELELIQTIRETMFSAEKESLEAAKQQITFEQELTRFREEQNRQADIQVRAAETFARLGRDRLEQERSITAEIIAQSRLRRGVGAEETFLRQRQDRLSILQQFQSRETALTSATERFRQQNARRLLNTGTDVLGFRPYMPTFDRPDVTRPDIAVRAMPTRTDEIAEYTHATALNTASIGEVVQEIRDKVGIVPTTGAATGTPVGNIALSGNVPNDVLNALQMAIMGQESGGNSRIQNGRTSATGLYQIMPDNIGPWTQAALGTRMSVDEFRNNPTAQRQVGRWQLNNYLNTQLQATGGNVEEAVRRVASSWYGGPDDATNASARRFRANEPSFYEYRESVLSRFRRAYGAVTGLGATQESAVDAVDPKRTAELQRRSREFLRPQRPVLPTAGRPNAPVEEEEPVRIFSNLNEAIASNKSQLDEWRKNIATLGASFSNLPDEIGAVSNEVETQEVIFNRLAEAYDSVISTARELAVVRAMDDHEATTRASRNMEIIMRGEINRRVAARETRDEIVKLQDEIAHASEGAADRIESAYLRAVKEIKAQNENATADVRIAIARIEDAGEFHQVRAQARILQHFASMKSSSDIYADGVIGTFDAIFGVVDAGLSRATNKLGIFGGVIKQVMSDLARMFLSRAFMKFMPALFSMSGASPSGMTGGNVGGNVVASVAQQTMPSFGGSFNNNNISQLFSSTGVGSVFRQFSIMNPDQSSLRPAVAVGPGASGPWVDPAAFTAEFGQPPNALRGAAGSLLPSFMSSAGAMLPAAALAISLSTWQAALSGNIGPGKGFLGGGLLGLGLSYIGRSRLRRQEENRRNEMLGDAKTQIQRLLDNVRRDRVDGDSALEQAQQIRDQYLQSVSTLKDKKTRNIAAATVRELDYLIGQLQTAALQQRRRKEIDNNLVAEFATGGVVRGIDRGYDSVLAALRPGEIVLNRQQQYNLSRITSPDVFRQIGVPGFDRGGVVRPVTMYQTQTVNNNSGSTGPIYIVTSQRYAEDMVRRAGGTVLNMVDSAISNREGLYSTVRGAAR